MTPMRRARVRSVTAPVEACECQSSCNGKGLPVPSIGPLELVVVLVIALVILGPKRLPDAARSLGSGLRGFKDSLGGLSDDRKALAQAPAESEAPSASTAAA